MKRKLVRRLAPPGGISMGELLLLRLRSHDFYDLADPYSEQVGYNRSSRHADIGVAFIDAPGSNRLHAGKHHVRHELILREVSGPAKATDVTDRAHVRDRVGWLGGGLGLHALEYSRSYASCQPFSV